MSNVTDYSAVLEKIILDAFLLTLLIYYIFIWRYIVSLTEIPAITVYRYLAILFPIIMYLPWLIVILYNYDTFIYGMQLFRYRIRMLSIVHKAFYAILSLFILFVIIIPLITPLIMIAIAFYLPYLIAVKLKSFVTRSFIVISIYIILFLTLLLGILLMLVPFYTIFLRDVLNHSLNVIEMYLSLIFGISICLGASAGVGSFIKLIYEGAREYDKSVNIPQKKINALEVILAMIFSATYIFRESFLAIASVLLMLSPIVTLIKRARGLGVSEKTVDFVSGLIFIVFALTSLLMSIEKYSMLINLVIESHIKLIAIIIASIMFLGIFIASVIDSSRKNYEFR